MVHNAPSGFVCVYKPVGMTSHDVVAILRRVYKQKAGHTGTLDPQAEGVLPICLGSATRLAQIMSDSDKEYRVEIIFGAETDTQDATGDITSEKPLIADEQAILAAIQSFKCEYEQMPPMYSAIKVKGKKLYELARKGIEVEREPRKVRILSIEVLELQLPHRAEILVRCSKGAYMRTLCEDIGRNLNSCAHMGRLVRTEAAGLGLSDALELSYIRNLEPHKLPGTVIPIEKLPALQGLRRVNVIEERDKRLFSGSSFKLTDINGQGDICPGERLLLCSSKGSLAAIYMAVLSDDGTDINLKPFIMLNIQEESK